MVNWKDNYEFVGYGSYFEEDINDEDSIFVWWKILLIAFGVVFAITIIIIIIIIYLRKKETLDNKWKDWKTILLIDSLTITNIK